MNKNIVEQFTG